MNYTEYLQIQSQVERMYDFHPDFFNQLEVSELDALRRGFLYDTDDDSYPESLKHYYESTVSVDDGLQKQMVTAVRELYHLSGSGSLEDNLKDTVSFSEQ